PLDLGDGRAIGARVLVTREAGAMADAGSPLWPPVRAPCRSLDHFLRALVRQMPQPESNRIFASPRGDVVQEGFDGKYVPLRAQRAQRGGADWHRQEAMAFDGPLREVVKWDRIAIGAAAIDLRRIGRDHARIGIGEFGRRQQRRLWGASRSCRMTVAPDRMVPVD